MAMPIAEATMLARAAQIPNLTLVRLPGNHHLHLEDAQPVANAIVQFAQRPATP